LVEDIIREIQAAEQQAVDMVAKARKEARDLLNENSQDCRLQAERIVDDAKQQAQSIVRLAQQKAAMESQLHVDSKKQEILGYAEKARLNLDAAVRLILERVV